MSEADKEKYSEFGKGLTYCLALFINHEDVRAFDDETKYRIEQSPYLWIYGAADHLIELELPDKGSLPADVLERIKVLRSSVLRSRLESDVNVTYVQCKGYCEEAKAILLEIDRHVFGIDPIKGEWE